MTFWTLIRRSLVFHRRSHLGVVLGAAIGSAALMGALVVGDSVRESLKDRAEARLGAVELALDTGDRSFGADLGARLDSVRPRETPTDRNTDEGTRLIWGNTGTPKARLLQLQGVAVKQDGTARAHQVRILTSTGPFWYLSPWHMRWQENLRLRLQRGTPQVGPDVSIHSDWEAAIMERVRAAQRPAEGGVRINRALADQLSAKPGDALILRFPKPSALSQDAVLSPRNEASVAMRLVVEDILDSSELGEFSLKSGQRPALNAFVNEAELWRVSGASNRANLLLLPGGQLAPYRSAWRDRVTRWFEQPRTWIPRSVADMIRRSARLGYHPTAAETELTLRHVSRELEQSWRLSDAEIEVREIEEPVFRTGGESMPAMIEVATRRIFLDPAVGVAGLTPRTRLLAEHKAFANDNAEELGAASFVTNGIPVLTYLANSLRAGERMVPYSIVTAAGSPWTPSDLKDDEIVVNEWLAKDLRVKPGDRVELAYYDPEAGARLVEKTNVFTVRQVVPLKGVHADRTLMPEFPGLAKAESTRDWDAGFPLVHTIRDEDEAYWKEYRGTPKAFVSTAAGRAMWANRFGEWTALRYPVPASGFASGFRRLVEANLVANLKPSDVGLNFRAIRSEALRAATSGQDFGGLFIGFSFFLVLGALLLMALLFQFGLEQRLPEVGVLLAMGFRPAQVRRLWLGEAIGLALVGGVLGALAGLGYAQAMIRGLATIWKDAVAGTPLSFHMTPGSLGIGFVASVSVCVFTLWLAMRRRFRRTPRTLMSGEVDEAGAGTRADREPARAAGTEAVRRLRVRRSMGIGGWGVGIGALAGGIALAAWAITAGESANPGIFFGAGSLILIAGVTFVRTALARMQGGGLKGGDAGGVVRLTSGWLAIRGMARRRSRSLATVLLLASGVFLVASLGVFRMDASKEAGRRASGTGGFGLLAESSLPVSVDLNSESGLEHFGLGTRDVAGVQFVPFRVKEGDDASCLNLDRAQRPRLLGVRPEALAERGAFRFGSMAKGIEGGSGWRALRDWREEGGRIVEVPAIGDMASIQWALGKRLGDSVELMDEAGRPFRVRLVGGVMNSILQGSLVMDEAALTRLYPGLTGYQWFLMDVKPGSEAEVSSKLTRALADVGWEVVPTTRRLAELNAVQNTYLGTFQVLGGLGLLLGSAGLGVVVLRNVLERRKELALLAAVGFRQGAVSRLVLVEHLWLLSAGVGIGLLGAAVAVLPSVLVAGVEIPLGTVGVTVGLVALTGLATTWVATRISVRGSLLAALRGE